MDNLATARDITRLFGELDALIVARILALSPTVAELDEAIREEEDEAGLGEEPRTPSSLRVANVRTILADVARDEADAEPQ